MLDKEATRASFGPRAAAYIIDRALLFAALLIVRGPAWLAALFGAGRLTARSFLFDHSALDVICWLLAAAYFVLMTYFTGGTLGKKVLRLQVEMADGSDLRFVDVIYRETVGRFLSGILCLGYLMALADREKRAFHDWLCGTRVVYAEVAFRAKEAKPAPAEAAGWSPKTEAPVAAGWSPKTKIPAEDAVSALPAEPAAGEELPDEEEA